MQQVGDVPLKRHNGAGEAENREENRGDEPQVKMGFKDDRARSHGLLTIDDSSARSVQGIAIGKRGRPLPLEERSIERVGCRGGIGRSFSGGKVMRAGSLFRVLRYCRFPFSIAGRIVYSIESARDMLI